MQEKQLQKPTTLRFLTRCLLALIMSTVLWHSVPQSAYSADPVLVKDINPGSGNSVTTPFHLQIGSILYFRGNDGVNGDELWRSDGTEAGTYMVKDIRPGASGSIPDYMVEYNGLLLFGAAADLTSGTELWRSDGTENGTYQLKDINPGSGSSYARNFIVVGDRLFFTATTAANGWELWKTDGTAAGTVMVKDIYPGTTSSSPANLTELNGYLFFSATSSAGSELWRSDGTDAGTVVIPSFDGNKTLSNPGLLISVGSTLFFRGTDENGDIELWEVIVYSRAFVVADINPTGSSSPYGLTDVNGTLYFIANDGTHGSELWKSDGTPAGTVMVKDILVGTGGSIGNVLTPMGDTLFFRANDGTHGTELWKSDGTAEGTILVADINPGSGSSNPNYLTVSSDLFFLQASDGVHGIELWQTDGTAANTILHDIFVGPDSSNAYQTITVNNILFFSANDGSHGVELMKIEGNAPAVSSIENQFDIQDTTFGPLAFTLSDVDSDLDSLTVTATSSNQILLSDENILLEGSGADRTVTLTPTPGQYGTAVITISIDDGTSISTQVFSASWMPIPVEIGIVKYDTIADAVNAATAGDIIRVAPGTYTGTGFKNINTLGKQITIKGISGAAATILDLENSGTGFIINTDGGRPTFDGLTIKNGTGYYTDNGASNDPSFYGGAIYAENTAIANGPRIYNCIFLSNDADHGGAVYTLNASPVITGSSFIGNESRTFGGALIVSGTDVYPIIRNTVFHNNSALISGGAMSVGWINAYECEFTGNIAESGYGGVILVNGFHQFENMTFVGNRAVGGGAVSRQRF